jgi:hypothetical protein
MRAFSALALAVVAVLLPIPVGSANATDTLTVWVAPDGNDSAAGTSRDQPVATLAGAQRVLCPASPCAGLGRPVDIRLEPGVYHLGAGVTWTYFDDTYPTRFIPAGYQTGDSWTQVSAAGGRPILDGDWTAMAGFTFTQSRPSTTGRTNLEFRYLEWRNLVAWAVLLEPSVGRAEGNIFVGCSFHHIGNSWHPTAHMGLAAIGFNRSDHNLIRNNHFAWILNEPVNGRGHEHAFYFVNSKSNTVSNNRFSTIGGAPIRFNNVSNGNLISGNTFQKTGAMAYADDWYCRPSLVASGVCGPVEYRSWGNVMRGNTYLGLYPQGLTGRSITYCHDLHTRCPADRIAVVS